MNTVTLYQQGISKHGNDTVEIFYSELKMALTKHTVDTGERIFDVADAIGISRNTLRNTLYRAKSGERGGRISKAVAYALATYLGVPLSMIAQDVTERRKWTRHK
jgi:transposase-like protein